MRDCRNVCMHAVDVEVPVGRMVPLVAFELRRAQVAIGTGEVDG